MFLQSLIVSVSDSAVPVLQAPAAQLLVSGFDVGRGGIDPRMRSSDSTAMLSIDLNALGPRNSTDSLLTAVMTILTGYCGDARDARGVHDPLVSALLILCSIVESCPLAVVAMMEATEALPALLELCSGCRPSAEAGGGCPHTQGLACLLLGLCIEACGLANVDQNSVSLGTATSELVKTHCSALLKVSP